MTTIRDWSNGKYPWDLAKCRCCLIQHVDGEYSLSCSQDHAEIRDVVTEQGLGSFFAARVRDLAIHPEGFLTPETDKWLTDNLEKVTAIRELFRDEYANNPAPPEQMELAFEPVATREV
jgi:hypothetical protein